MSYQEQLNLNISNKTNVSLGSDYVIYGYGLFKDDYHIYTYSNEKAANEMMFRCGEGYSVRELTFDEYFKRMKEIYIEEKHKCN